MKGGASQVDDARLASADTRYAYLLTVLASAI
jgi:hypothetical protein